VCVAGGVMTVSMSVEDVEARLSSLSAALAFLGVNAGCHVASRAETGNSSGDRCKCHHGCERNFTQFETRALPKFPRKEGTIQMSTCSTRTPILLANSTACNWEYVMLQ